MARGLQGFGGVATLFFIASFLTEEEQGFYYTFGSILAIQLFFELGLNGIITQYVAHEAAHLTWVSSHILSGPTDNLSRLSSLLRLVVKWYFLLGILMFVVLLTAGFFFFAKYGESSRNVTWMVPWMLLCVSNSIGFLINPALSFLEGLGKVAEVAKMRLYQQMIALLLIWATLFFGTKLYASAISSLTGLFIVGIFVWRSGYIKLFYFLWYNLNSAYINYRKEIFPYQWKIAVSWISGYFIFQLFNPVLFATDGPVMAGRMGMTLAALNGILSLSLSWINTKVPLFSSLIAKKDYGTLDKVFNKTLKQSAVVNGLGLIILMCCLLFLMYINHPLLKRFLPFIPLIFMMIPIFLNQIVASWATYLRCHKEEPFLINSIVTGVAVSLSTLVLGKLFGVTGMTAGYCFVIVSISFFWGKHIFITKKREWHSV